MNLSKKMRAALILAGVFVFTFLTVFLVIFLTQPAHSTPDSYVLEGDGMAITIGPKPNSTDVPLDTTITIDALASAALNDLHLTPEVPIARVTSEVSGPLSYKQTFYPAQLLKPATSYTVSVTIVNVPVSWSFTTTSELYHPTISFYLATYVLWIAFSTATATTLLVGLAIWYRKKRVYEPSSLPTPNRPSLQKPIEGIVKNNTTVPQAITPLCEVFLSDYCIKPVSYPKFTSWEKRKPTKQWGQ
jgi:hypothetical protein